MAAPFFGQLALWSEPMKTISICCAFVVSISTSVIAQVGLKYANWAEGPIRHLMTKEELKQWNAIRSSVGLHGRPGKTFSSATSNPPASRLAIGRFAPSARRHHRGGAYACASLGAVLNDHASGRIRASRRAISAETAATRAPATASTQ